MTSEPKIKATIVEPKANRAIRPLMEYDLYLPIWNATAKDKAAAKEVKKSKGITAEGEFIRVIVDLLPECKELESLNSFRRQIRNEFYLLTAPWREKRGRRVGLIGAHFAMDEWWAQVLDTDDKLLDALCAAYGSAVQEAQFKLQGAFDASKYPSVAEVRSKFGKNLDWNPLQNVANDIRVITQSDPEWDGLREEMAAKFEAEMHAAIDGAVKDLVGGLLPPLKNMVSQLDRYHKGEAKKIYDTLVDNVRDMAARVRRLNMRDDPQLEAFAIEAEKLVEGITADDLKESEGLQVEKARAAEDLVARMEAVYGSV
jgi:hypothetical protein